MNYAIFSEWVRDRVDELVRFGVPREEAEHLMRPVELGAIAAEARERGDRQFLLDLKRVGSAGMAQRLGITPAAVMKRRAKLLKSQPPVASRVA